MSVQDRNTSALEQQLRVSAEQAARAEGCELLELQIRDRGSRATIAITLDRQPQGVTPHSVTIEECARVSRRLSAWLESSSLNEPRYALEVSSPGLCRPLKSFADYQRFRSRLALLELSKPLAGRTRFRGILGDADANLGLVRMLEAESGLNVEICFGDIARGRLDFDVATSPKSAAASKPRQASKRSQA